MEQITIFHDRTGNTLTVWFGNPEDEYICEETGAEVILMKDSHGRVIGIEKLNYLAEAADSAKIVIHAIAEDFGERALS